jgi:hypothetical protein
VQFPTDYPGKLPKDAENLRRIQEGAPVCLHSFFKPNQGLHCDPPDDQIALAVELHLAEEHRLGRVVLLTLADALKAAAAERYDVHVSPCFIAAKRGKPLGRLCINYLHCGPYHPDKKAMLAEEWGPIQLYNIADFCRMMEHVRTVLAPRFPPSSLQGFKVDASAFYHLIALDPDSAGVFSTIINIRGERYLAVMLTGQFGSQDSNYQANMGSRLLKALQHERQTKLYRCTASLVYR